MRRSCAPSVRRAEKRKLETNKPENTNAAKAKEPLKALENRKEGNILKDNKIAFNIQWREIRKQHKNWVGDGILLVHVDEQRAVLTDHTGKYMGASKKIKITDLIEGYQMNIGDKQIELLDEIKTQNEFYAARKLQVQNRGWGSEEWEPPEEKRKFKSNHMPQLYLGEIPRSTTKQQSKSKTYVKQQCKKNSLEIAENLSTHLRPHQREGVYFMYHCLMGSKINDDDYYGCILADEMGLGKTLQVLTVAHSLLRNQSQSTVHRVLIVTPSSLIANWDNEIHKWLLTERMYGFVVDSSSSASNNRKKLSGYAQATHMPFVIVSYETLVSQMPDFQVLNFDLLICDEGHRLKNPDTKTYKTLRDLNIKRCILLTGTPVQNILSEFFAMANFVNPGILGTSSEFRRYFEIPIELGQTPSASEEEKALAAERIAELKQITFTFMLRRSKDINLKYLPKKTEYICFLCPSKLQHRLLRKAISVYNDNKKTLGQEISSLEIIGLLRKICNHPFLLKRSKGETIFHSSLASHLKDLRQMNIEHSSKLFLLQNLLQDAVLHHREKVILVSYHTKTLDILQDLCEQLNLKYFRLDGATSTTDRKDIVSKFNLGNDVFVLLLSAKAGGVGLNLIGASRLVLYDIDWNPANDAQALSRIWREGQEKDVHLYRLITAGTIEEKIFQRQVAKTNLGDFVLSEEGDSSGASCSVSAMKFSPEELQDLCYLQYDYNVCDTHESLKCGCEGTGENPIDFENETKNTKINALMKWKHWKPNSDETFMQEACLSSSNDDLIYIFTSETSKKTNVAIQ